MRKMIRLRRSDYVYKGLIKFVLIYTDLSIVYNY